MSLEALTELSKVRELSNESKELLMIARYKGILLDEKLEEQVRLKSPSQELLNKSCSI